MRVLTVYAHPNPKSFCHAILQEFTRGLADAGHVSDVVDLYAIQFDPVFRMQDFASYVHEGIPLDILEQMNLKERVLESAGGPIRRFIASRWLRDKDLRTVARFIDSASARTTGTGPWTSGVKFCGAQVSPFASGTSTGASSTRVAGV